MTTRKRSVGAPPKYKELLKKQKWDQIVEFIKYGVPRDGIAKLMAVNKDTLLRAIKEKGYDDYEDLKNQTQENFRFHMKRKILGKILAGKASEKMELFYWEKYILPFEEFNQKESEENNVKTVYVPIVDFGSPEEMQKHVEMQQAKLQEEINEQKRKLDEEDN